MAFAYALMLLLFEIAFAVIVYQDMFKGGASQTGAEYFDMEDDSGAQNDPKYGTIISREEIMAGRWPWLTIRLVNLPPEFNLDIVAALNATGKAITDPSHPAYDALLEYEFHRQLLNSPLLTDDEDAKLHYVPFYPTLAAYAGRDVGELSRKFWTLLRRTPAFVKRNGFDHFVFQVRHLGDSATPFYHEEMVKHNVIIGSEWYPLNLKVDNWQKLRNFIVPSVAQITPAPKRGNYVFIAAGDEGLRQAARAALPSSQFEVVLEDDSNAHRMAEAKFCIVPKRAEVASNRRLYDAIQAGCLPIVLSNAIWFAYENSIVDYPHFLLHVNETRIDTLPEVIRNVTAEKYERARRALAIGAERLHFSVGGAPRIGDGFWATAWMLWYKFMFFAPNRRVGLIKNAYWTPPPMPPQG